MSTEVYQRGETIPIWLEVRDWDDTLTDPDAAITLVHLTNPSGTVKVTNQAMTKSETGIYVYYYASASDDVVGWWRYQIKTQDGSGDGARYTITEGGFELK